jgi:DNA-binding NarL/FixJ family response regulator
MTIQHFFLSSSPLAPGARWQKAFPQGQCVDAFALERGVLKLPANQFLVWLSSEDSQWPQMLAFALQTRGDTRVVLLSAAPNPAEGVAALNSGALGYTHTYALPEVLREVATVVAHGGLWTGPELLKRLVAKTFDALSVLPLAAAPTSARAVEAAKAWANLSARELQVAQAVAEGRSNKEVADLLSISERTVKAHLGSVFEKLGIRDRLQLVLFVASVRQQAPVNPRDTV